MASAVKESGGGGGSDLGGSGAVEECWHSSRTRAGRGSRGRPAGLSST